METEIGWSRGIEMRYEKEKQRYEEEEEEEEEEKQRYDEEEEKQRYEEEKQRFEEEKQKHKKAREKSKSIYCISFGNTDTDSHKFDTTEKERSGEVSCRLYKAYKDFTLDGFTEEGFISDMERYRNDMKRSDGFDVGVYPHRRASGLISPHFVSLFYNPSINHNPNLRQTCVDTLLCLSNLAISLYNMHQPTPTYYDSVNVLKAMNFGCMASNYNITFQASLPPAQIPATFQTRVLTLSLFRVFQIVFVRKVNGDEYQANSLPSQDVDFIGDQNLSHLIDTNIYAPYTDSGFKLSLYLSQLALHMLNEDQLHLNMDKLLQTVNVLDTKKSLLRAPEEGAAYLITFEAFLPYKSIIQTKIYLSPLVPPATIKIKSVKFLHPTDRRALLW